MKLSTLAKSIAPVLVVGLGIAVFVALVKTRPTPAKAQATKKALLVTTTQAARTTHQLTVRGQGTVIPAQQIVLQAEVNGKIQELHPNLVSGGLLAKGDVAFKIDPKDFRLTIAQRASNVQQARFNLQLEQGRRAVAEREWELVGSSIETDPQGKALALRTPHIRNARSSLSGAQAALQQAQVNLKRATVEVPFNAIVTQETVDLGSFVGPQSQIATLVGTDQYWVRVSIPYDDLPFLTIPGINTDQPLGSTAKITQKIQTKEAKNADLQGNIVRLLPDTDPVGRMARVILQVDDPLGLKAKDSNTPRVPLLLNSFVDVSFNGRTLKDVIKIPRAALRSDNTVWVIKDKTLAIQNVTVAWGDYAHVYISNGLNGDDQVITSTISAPVQGMALRTSADLNTTPAAQNDGPTPKLKLDRENKKQ